MAVAVHVEAGHRGGRLDADEVLGGHVGVVLAERRRQLEVVHGTADVARRHARDEVAHVVRDAEGHAGLVVRRALEEPLDLCGCGALELEHEAAREQRVVDGMVGVLGRGRDERDAARLGVGEQRLLLALVEVLHLVEVDDGVLVACGDALDVCDRRVDGVQAVQRPVEGSGVDERGRRLAAARGAIEYHRACGPGLGEVPQDAGRPDDAGLADHAVERPRPQRLGKRRCGHSGHLLFVRECYWCGLAHGADTDFCSFAFPAGSYFQPMYSWMRPTPTRR